MQLRNATLEDVNAICAIYNKGIQSGSATFDTSMRTPTDIENWLAEQSRYPVIVGIEKNNVIGFARLSKYSDRDCYKTIAEFSIYLADEAKGKGLGTKLLSALLSAAKSGGVNKVLSRIFTFNHASLSLCEKLGFREVGIYQRHGKIDGKWLDVVIVEKLL
ncbi:N-acetyltransferase [Alteromonas sp. 38]|uniref:arsinothricin resistance N-acetyltransferase ArsN1 family A n=1 Tax=unclassified Alteromonas TaxID=2614992 RepID=UPI0012EFF8BF|nr:MULTISPECIES: arsinothricin resistance N-acetyltransferase ArsN1 family A [unclassified Alteromonas]CAD5283497.1 N-acetyltransferase [Alteromonas sp. 154]VXB47333.1 N-acetyltransferase [Alteromonas sp. 38]